MKIYKYPLEVTDEQEVLLPVGYQILDIQLQEGRPCIWALVDESPIMAKEKVIIECFGTGHEIKGGPRRYISTIQIHGTGLVFHFFEYTGL